MTLNSTAKIETLLDKYADSGKPINVDFRALVKSEFDYSQRTAHLIHPYTAKLLAQIPYFFLSTPLFCRPGGLVLDPFCGSGTVLLEALLAGRNAIGSDINPMARLISTVKTTPIPKNELIRSIERLSLRIPDRAELPNTLGEEYNYWFYPHVLDQLARLFVAVKSVRIVEHRNFFLVCFSSLLKFVSLADPRLSVPVRQKKEHYPLHHPFRISTENRLRRLKRINVISEFWRIVEVNIKRISPLVKSINLEAKVLGIGTDARRLNSISRTSTKSPDLIITSPPYSGAQKYTRASSLSLSWLASVDEISISTVEKNCIGRESFKKKDYSTLVETGIPNADSLLKEVHNSNPIRAHIAATYLNEMRVAITEMSSIQKKDAHFILIAGNNYVCGKKFRTVEFLRQIAESVGYSTELHVVDEIKSRGLMTKRNKTANLITRESVYIFKKSR